MRAERAAILTARAEVLYDRGQFDDALAECRSASAIQSELAGVEREPPATSTSLETMHLEAKLLQASLRWEEALPIELRIVAELRSRLLVHPGDPELARELALGLAHVAASRSRIEGPASARSELEEGLALVRQLGTERPDDAETLATHGMIARDLAAVEVALGEHAAAIELASAALEASRAAAVLEPSARSYRSEVGSSLAGLASAFSDSGECEQAQPLYRDALSIYSELSRDFPASARYRLEQARVTDEQAVSLRFDSPEQAYQLHEEAVARYEALLALQPDRCQLRLAAAVAWNNFANLLLNGLGRTDDALHMCERGFAVLEPCRERMGEAARRSGPAQRLAYLHALALCAADQPDRAWPEVLAFEQLAGSEAWCWRYAADLWNEWILASRRIASSGEPATGDERSARERMFAALRRAIELGFRDIDELRTTPALRFFHGDPELAELFRLLEVE